MVFVQKTIHMGYTGLHRIYWFVDLDDIELLNWLQKDSNLGLFSYLSDLEYMVWNEFNTFLHYPIVIFNFVRYTKIY